MNIGNQDNSTSVCDGSLSGDSGEGSPFLKVQRNIHVRDQTVSLGVSGAADEEPPEHGVASVPLLGVDGRTPSVLGKGAEFFFPLCCGFLVNRRISNVQAVNGNGYTNKRENKGLITRREVINATENYKIDPCDLERGTISISDKRSGILTW